MKKILLTITLLNFLLAGDKMEYNKLNEFEKKVIEQKGTERAFTGEYYAHKENGTYTCKKCNAPLFKSDAKFDSGTGWPSFDDTIKGAIKEIPDSDGRRVEIVCATCGAHLGHVFKGEGFTSKSTRHCVNSVSLNFKKEK
jgi:methionine-R-sulfoxide reductase